MEALGDEVLYRPGSDRLDRPAVEGAQQDRHVADEPVDVLFQWHRLNSGTSAELDRPIPAHDFDLDADVRFKEFQRHGFEQAGLDDAPCWITALTEVLENLRLAYLRAFLAVIRGADALLDHPAVASRRPADPDVPFLSSIELPFLDGHGVTPPSTSWLIVSIVGTTSYTPCTTSLICRGWPARTCPGSRDACTGRNADGTSIS